MTKYYAVKNGRTKGIYTDWNSCSNQVKGYSGSQYKSFKTKAEADAYLNSFSSVPPSLRPNISLASCRSLRSSPQPYLTPSISTKPFTHSKVEIYTDGASKNNQKAKTGGSKAGYGVYYGPDDPRNYSGRVTGEQTNNRGELQGILHALENSYEEVKNGKKNTYVIHTDSQYSKEAITNWGKAWEKNGWKTSSGTDVANKDLVKQCRELVKKIEENSGKVEIVKVKGHSGVHGNVMADKLAVDGCFK
ncbi:uncharacterized protein C5L36_0C05690 [Pichia kudriavzevii]|uniref:Ribonuclease H n=1 Tax=Pichia kudriavzevii TaxID=4909 RepID=A0A1V2LMJ2_PICKU|nr:uncharacterized protein C5L36_0C05690 [Pichia kudriavzevii]AWU76643.1 hypothetical protein C5L36_0C05690 [Pichia kudriavzevii]ONH73979.1 Ribonuclease H1 [Pichia kudriavzevii]